MMLLAFAALALSQQEVCLQDMRPSSIECRAQLAVTEGRHADAGNAFVQLAERLSDPAGKARAYAAAAPLFALAKDHERTNETAAAAIAFNALPPLQQGWTMIDRAQALHQLDRADEAETQWLKAGELVADDPFYWWVGASMALEKEQLDAARTRVVAGLERADDSPELHLLSGQVALAAGDEAAAREAFTAAILAQPDHRAGLAAARALAALGEE